MDSLWGVAGSELRDWETMTALLLQEAGEEQEETVITRQAVKTALTAELSPNSELRARLKADMSSYNLDHSHVSSGQLNMLLFSVSVNMCHLSYLSKPSPTLFLFCFAPVCTSLLSGLMYEEEGALIELMMCAVRQAAQATPPVGRTQGKKVVTQIYGTVKACGGERNVIFLFFL